MPKERERQIQFPSTVSLPSGPISQDWAGLSPGARIFILVVAGTQIWGLPRYMSRALDQN